MEACVDDMWTPYKEFVALIDRVIRRPKDSSFEELKTAMMKHRQNFLTLLKNPTKCAKHREELNKGPTEGIELPGEGHSVLPKEFVSEAIIISDMYNLNEYMALDLLGTAQQQMPNYPELPRGVVAVLLYYDSRKSIVTALKSLVQAREGHLWTVDAPSEVIKYITNYTNDLIQDGLIQKLLSAIEGLDVEKEKEILQKNRALGPPRYQQQVIELIESTKQDLAEVVYLIAAQTGLTKEPSFALLNYLRSLKLSNEGPMDTITLILMVAFLYTIDLSLLHRETGDALQRKIPLVMGSGPNCSNFLGAMQDELSRTCEKPWADEGIRTVVQMGWAITLSHLRMVPQLVPRNVKITDNPDLVMEEAIQGKLFKYLYTSVFSNKYVHREVFVLKRMHGLMTDFLSLMPHKVKEMRMRAEETDRTIHAFMHEGVDPPSNLSHHFEHLLLSISKLYEYDPLNLQLEMDYWSASDSRKMTSFLHRAQPKREVLYSFVLQTSEVLPPTLFVPYLKMLTSLSSCSRGAQQCFNLLKNNDNKNLTWDHFFNSFNRYFHNLRQESLPTTDTVYRARTYNKGITPQELMGLQAVLDLIRSVAENDPGTGEKMCQCQQWSPITVLLGLITCAVPIPLKANLLNTLAAFAKSSTTAASLWHSIEASQIITTVPSTSNFHPRGIQTELEEIECRNEEYPLTRAILRLFNALTDRPIPKLLGASQRIPGFDPYLNFILNSVLLRFASRSYKNPSEKWEVCEGAMSLICKLLLQYDPLKDDFLSKHVHAYSIGTAQVNPPPGYHLMISLCSKSELLRLLLLLIDEGCRVFDLHSELEGKEQLENSVLSALRMLEHGLAIQHRFLSLLNTSNSSILLVGLNKLILGINEVTNKPDHLLNIAKYVTYQPWLPLHSLPAVNVLLLVTSYPTPHGHLLSLFLSSPGVKAAIRHGFVTCLEAEEEIIEGSEEEEALADENDPRRVATKTKKAICLFLLQTLNQGIPNVAHYLFGFDLTKEIKKTVLEQAGVRGMPRSCLHSILCLLNGYLNSPCEYSFSLVELYYRLIYALAYNTRTSEPTLRFLRSSGDFLKRHLSALPFSSADSFGDSGDLWDSQLRQMSWLLKTVAIEMKVTASNQQLSQLRSMVETFTGCSKVNNPEETFLTLSSSNAEKVKQNEQLVLSLIKFMKFNVDPVPDPDLELIAVQRLKKLMEECIVEEGKRQIFDIRSLHVHLENELGSHNNSLSGPHRSEIHTALSYATKVNAASRLCSAMIKFFDAWRQVTEVMFAVVTHDALNLEKRFNLLVDVIHELLAKAVHAPNNPELANLVSGSVLLLCVDLRQTYTSEMGKGDETDSKLCNFMDSNHYKLSTVVTNLIKWILCSGVASQKLRANLYAALLNFLHLSREKVVMKNGAGKTGFGGSIRPSLYVSLLDERPDRAYTGIDIVLAHGDRLVEMLSHDSSTSHDICKMLALSCLDMIVELDAQTTWTSVLSSRGYLKYIIDSLLDADKHLIALLSNNVKSLKWLYVYESKMALLCRIASTHIGAEMLLEQNALSCLAALQVYNKHPDIISKIPPSNNMDVDFVPNMSSRYLQIVSPALSLCDAIVSSMGVENQMAVMQVLKFILSHGEMVTLVLRAGSPYHPLCYLKELSLLTGVIARTSSQEALRALDEEGMDPGGLLESTSIFNRIQQLMLRLVSRFAVSESLVRELDKEAEKTTPKEHTVLSFLQIVAHLVLYVRNIISCGGTDRRISTVVFQPALADVSIPDRRDMLSMQEATIGVIVQQLVHAVAHHNREKSNLDHLVQNLLNVPDAEINTLKQYVNGLEVTESDELRREATRCLSSQVNLKKNELDLCLFIIEHSVYIIWAHLDYYMLRALSAKTLSLPSSSAVNRRGGVQPMEFDVTWTVTSDDLNQLKQGLLSVFNDTFTTSLLATVQDLPPKEKGFLEALLRRIKKLIQFVPN